MGVRDFTVYDMICRNTGLFPGKDAVVSKAGRLTFKEYKEKCDALAAGLLKEGIKRGDRLGIVSQNCEEFMVLYGAAAKIGAVLLPVNWRFQQHEVEFVLNDCTPRFVFAGPEYVESVSEAAGKVPSIEKRYLIGAGTPPSGFVSFDDLYSESGPGADPDIPADSGFVIIHTAAVEGQPRGALLSQANVIFSNLQLMYGDSLGPDDCFLCILPLFHIAALSTAMAMMHAGGKSVIVERFDPEEALNLVAREGVTTLMYFPPILKLLIDKYKEGGGTYDLSSLRHANGLDSPENMLAFREIAPQAQFGTGFGQTEAYPVSGGPMDARPGSAGRPSPLARVALFDDYGNEVLQGTPGEICVKSPVVFSGYWGREQDNARTFRDGWHHTGDIGRFDEDGFLWYVKRKAEKELIKPGGENVYPSEVERVILGHEAVAEVSVIGVPDDQWGEAVKAVCVLKPGKALGEQELIDFVGSKIARYKKPKYVSFVASLPKTQEGEVDRDRIKKEHGGKY